MPRSRFDVGEALEQRSVDDSGRTARPSTSSSDAETEQKRSRARFTKDECFQALCSFLLDSDELFGRRWDGYGMSTTTVVNYMGMGPWAEMITDFALEYAPHDRIYTWPLCPMRKRHTSPELFRGTKVEWLQSQCSVCERQMASREAWLATVPTFAEQYPELVEHLDNQADAESRAQMVAFRCASCGRRGTPWSPRSGGIPTCTRCLATQGQAPGEPVPRRGGGESTRIEAKVAAALRQRGFDVATNLGVVVREGSYYRDVIKPDLLIPRLRIAIEIDTGVDSDFHENRHMTQGGADDDMLRDQLLAELGWRVLRVREPGSPVRSTWPWRIETSSSSETRLAELIRIAITSPDPAAPANVDSGPPCIAAADNLEH